MAPSCSQPLDAWRRDHGETLGTKRISAQTASVRSKAGFSDSPPHWIKRTRRSDAQPPLVLFRLAKATVTWLALVRNHTLHLAGWPRQRISSSGSVSKGGG